MDQLVCFVRIGQIVLASVFESPDMVKSMISQTMSPFYNHLNLGNNFMQEGLAYRITPFNTRCV